MLPRLDIEQTGGTVLVTRLAEELAAALRRRPAHEDRLAAAVEVLVPESQRLAEAAMAALDVLVRRGMLERPLYGALLRALIERGEAAVEGPLEVALRRDDAGGLGTLTAAAVSGVGGVHEALGRISGSRSPALAFAAELTRSVRGESPGTALGSMALRIKESHRMELFSEMLRPLIRRAKIGASARESLAILRGSERHLGRWLCLAEGARLAGDVEVREEALRESRAGALSARSAWSLVAWALGPRDAPCSTRPTLELVARLSDRPSSERELSFLFRMAEAGQATANPMLSNLTRPAVLDGDNAVRACFYLLRNAGRRELIDRLREAGRSAKCEGSRGLALACLYDLDPELVDGIPLELDRSRQLATAVWSALVRQAKAMGLKDRLVTDERCRVLAAGLGQRRKPTEGAS